LQLFILGSVGAGQVKSDREKRKEMANDMINDDDN
jgi:hypothetical protein